MRAAEDQRDIGDLVRLGRIASVNLGTKRCTVEAGDLITGPIRWLAMRAGGTRTWSPPTEGEQCILICADGEVAAGIAMLGIPSDAFPEAGDGPRELVLFADGAELSYDPEAHRLEAKLPDGGTAQIEAPGGLNLIGDVSIVGKLTVSETIDAQGEIIGSGVALGTHVHQQVKAGTDLSGEPKK